MYLAKQKTIDPKPRAMQPRVLSENFERHGTKWCPLLWKKQTKIYKTFETLMWTFSNYENLVIKIIKSSTE